MAEITVFEVVGIANSANDTDTVYEVFEDADTARRYAWFLYHAEVNMTYKRLLVSERRMKKWLDEQDEDYTYGRSSRNLYEQAVEDTWGWTCQKMPTVWAKELDIVPAGTTDAQLRRMV